MCLYFTIPCQQHECLSDVYKAGEDGKSDSPLNTHERTQTHTHTHTHCRLSKQVSIYFRPKLSWLHFTHALVFSYSVTNTSLCIVSISAIVWKGAGSENTPCSCRAEWRVGLRLAARASVQVPVQWQILLILSIMTIYTMNQTNRRCTCRVERWPNFKSAGNWFFSPDKVLKSVVSEAERWK